MKGTAILYCSIILVVQCILCHLYNNNNSAASVMGTLTSDSKDINFDVD